MQVSTLGDGGPDDLPRAFRRERDAQTQAAQAQATAQTRGYAPAQPVDTAISGDDPVHVTVTRFKVPFLNLVGFFLKCTLAAIPAMLLLLVILFGIGKMVGTYAPDLAKVRVLIHVPQ